MPDPLTKSGLRVPSVHLNGTSRDELLKQLRDSYLALAEATRMMAQAAPHGRDYYVQADLDALKLAIIQHRQRMGKIAEVAKELTEIAEAIQDQGKD